MAPEGRRIAADPQFKARPRRQLTRPMRCATGRSTIEASPPCRRSRDVASPQRRPDRICVVTVSCDQQEAAHDCIRRRRSATRAMGRLCGVPVHPGPRRAGARLGVSAPPFAVPGCMGSTATHGMFRALGVAMAPKTRITTREKCSPSGTSQPTNCCTCAPRTRPAQQRIGRCGMVSISGECRVASASRFAPLG